MSTAFALIAMLMLLVVAAGLVLGIFIRGRRKLGWKLVGAGFVAFCVALGAFSYTADSTGSQTLAAAVEAVSEAPKPQIEGASQPSPVPASSKLGSSAVAAYCDGYKKTVSIIHEADRKFGIEGSDAKADWVKAQDQAIGVATGEAIGVPFEEWQPVAQAEHWDQQCQAMARGWLTIDDADLLAARASDAEAVVTALEAVYRVRIDEGRDLPFSRYGSVKCGWKELKQHYFAACTLSGGSNGGRSDPFLYFVGHKAAQAVIVPFDNEALDHMPEGSYVEGAGGKVPLGWYIAVPFRAVPYVEVKALFE
jgi:hypothetical protein